MTRPLCIVEGCDNLTAHKNLNKDGAHTYRSKCHKHFRSKDYKRRRQAHKKGIRILTDQRKGYCECCGFVAENICQLDLDHIDGNHYNNSQDNLQTLCANCHRLKTYMNKDWGG